MLRENYIIKGVIICETGLHIGNSSDNIDIGANDNPIIRDSINNLPYIPGSSLKGKLRTLIELNDPDSIQSVIDNNGRPSSSPDCIATQIFGISGFYGVNEEKLVFKFPTRTIVRDAYPTEDTINFWKNNDDILEGAEMKYENTIDRIRSKSLPRNIERIPRGSKFNFEIIFSVYKGDDEKNLVHLLRSMRLLEDNYLGSSGTRGFGKIRFKDIIIIRRDLEYYLKGVINENNTLTFENMESVWNTFKKVVEG